MSKQIELKIHGLECICVPLDEADFKEIAAIYIIICLKNGKYNVIDIGQSGELGTRIDAHSRKLCWKLKCPKGKIYVCIYKMPSKKYSKEQRLALEKKLRALYTKGELCGKR